MSSLIALLADAIALTQPGPSELEVAGPAALLEHLRGAVPAASLPALAAAVARCAAGDAEAIEGIARLLAPIAEEPEELGTVAAGLLELLALRGALQAGPRAAGRLQLRAPAAFASLRRLSLPHPPGQPATVLVGCLADGVPLELGRPAGGHKLRPHIEVAFDAGEPGPLLTIGVPSRGPQVPRQLERHRWPQPVGPAGAIRASQRDNYCDIVTQQQSEPLLIVSPGLQVEIAPSAGTDLYVTQILDEQKRPLSIYARAYQSEPAANRGHIYE